MLITIAGVPKDQGGLEQRIANKTAELNKIVQHNRKYYPRPTKGEVKIRQELNDLYEEREALVAASFADEDVDSLLDSIPEEVIRNHVKLHDQVVSLADDIGDRALPAIRYLAVNLRVRPLSIGSGRGVYERVLRKLQLL